MFLSWAALFAAPAAGQSTLYGSVGFGTPKDLYTIDVSTGAATSVGPLNLSFLDGLAYDTDDGVMYGVTNGGLHTIDLETGAASTVGAFGGGPVVESIAYDSSTQTLYGVGTGGADFLVTIDQATGALTGVGALGGSTSVFGLTYDPNADVLYGLDPFANQLMSIDRTTGAASAVGGTLGVPAPFFQALAFDSETNKLFGAEQHGDNLYEIDTATGSASLVGGFGLGDITGMAFVPPTPPPPPPPVTIEALFATSFHSPLELLELDATTGAKTTIGPLGDAAGDYTGLAFDSSREALLGIGSAFNSGAGNYDPASLVRVDPETGDATQVGLLGAGNDEVVSLAYNDDDDVLHAVRNASGGVAQLLSIDPVTGASTVLTDLNFIVPGEGELAAAIQGMAYDTETDRLYIASSGELGTQAGPQLYEVNATTGDATTVGALPLDTTGLTYDFVTNTLYAINGGKLFEVNPANAAMTQVGTLPGDNLRNLTFAQFVVPQLVGDYNDDGVVDAADYTVWRDTLGQTGEGLAADGNRDGAVSQTDYELWRSNYGQTGSATVMVPEPSALLLSAMIGFVGLARRAECRVGLDPDQT